MPPANDQPPAATTLLDRRQFLGRASQLGAAGIALRVGVVGGAAGLSTAFSTAAQAGTKRTGASSHDAAVLNDWFATLYSGIMDEAGMTPGRAARVYACVSIAAYESLLGGAPQLRPLGGQVTGLRRAPHGTSQAPTDWPLMASAAIAASASGLLRDASASLRAAIAEQLATHVDERRTANVDANVLRRSQQRGRDVGEHVAAWALSDGAEDTYARAYTPPVGASLWRSTAPNFGTAIDPYWGSVRTMALPTSSFCAPTPHVRFSTGARSAFRRQADAVIAANGGLDDAGRATALYWRDNPTTSGLPSGHWARLALDVCVSRGLTLDRTAEVMALTTIALSDAFISCWEEKYTSNLLRPISYIRAHVPGQENWSSYVNTPQFPEYTSGHSVASKAAAVVLTNQLGTKRFTDSSHLLRNSQLGTRTYANFTAAASEAAGSRLLGGIHYPMGIDAGLDQGDHVGRTVLDRIRTRV